MIRYVVVCKIILLIPEYIIKTPSKLPDQFGDAVWLHVAVAGGLFGGSTWL